MKYIALFVIATSLGLSQDTAIFWSRTNNTTAKPVATLDSSLLLNIKSSQTLKIFNDAGKSLTLDFSGDTLKTYGELHPDSASVVFFEFCMKRWLKWRKQ